MYRALIALILLTSTSAAALELKSTDVKDGAPIPQIHFFPRCGGQNLSPALSWSAIPKGAKSLVLTVIDVAVKPKGWSHWVAIDLPPTSGSLARGAKDLPPGAHGLISDFGDPVYAGPCPPTGTGVHRYEITLWALPDAHAAITDGSAAIGPWLEQHAIAKARITGTAER